LTDHLIMAHILRRSVGSHNNPCPPFMLWGTNCFKVCAVLQTLKKCPRNFLACDWRMVPLLVILWHSSDEVTSRIRSNSSTMLLYLKRSYTSCIIHAYRMCCIDKTKVQLWKYVVKLCHTDKRTRGRRGRRAGTEAGIE
jgi:hypothetical protein